MSAKLPDSLKSCDITLTSELISAVSHPGCVQDGGLIWDLARQEIEGCRDKVCKTLPPGPNAQDEGRNSTSVTCSGETRQQPKQS